MSKVRVLVGTRKGAFILTADGKRGNWDVTGPPFAGWELYPPERLSGRSQPHLCVADQRMVWPAHSALRRRRQIMAPARNTSRGAADARSAESRQQQVCLRHVRQNRQAANHASVLRRHAASLGV